MNEGIAHLVKGEIKEKRSTLMPVEVPKSASKVIVWHTAIDKHMAHNYNLPCTEEWQLVYPDFQQVDNIPGTNDFFTVEKYNKSNGKTYAQVNLFLCRTVDRQGIYNYF